MKELVSIKEAAEQLRRSPQWLRRHLLALEHRTGRAILVRRGAKRPLYYVSPAALRVFCPELFDVRDPIAKALGGWRSEIRNEIGALREVIEDLEARITAQAITIRGLASRLPRRSPAATGGRPLGEG